MGPLLQILKEIARLYVILLNSLLMIAGLVTVIRGIAIRNEAMELRKNVLVHFFGVDNLVMQIAMAFIIPGCIMTCVACCGCCGAVNKGQCGLRLYSSTMLIFIGWNINNLIDKNELKVSLFTSSALDFMSMTEIRPIPELIVQILALLSSLYVSYYIKRKEQNDLARAELLNVARAYLQA